MDLPNLRDESTNAGAANIGSLVLKSLNFMKHNNGSSLADIKKHMKSNYHIDVDRSVSKAIQLYLRNATEKNIVTQVNGKYILTGVQGQKRHQTEESDYAPAVKRRRSALEKSATTQFPAALDTCLGMPSSSSAEEFNPIHTTSQDIRNGKLPAVAGGNRSVKCVGISRGLNCRDKSTRPQAAATRRKQSLATRRKNRRQDTTSHSPDYVKLVRQMEDDEGFARSLQAKFDAEVQPQHNSSESTHIARNASLASAEQASSSITSSQFSALFDDERSSEDEHSETLFTDVQLESYSSDYISGLAEAVAMMTDSVRTGFASTDNVLSRYMLHPSHGSQANTVFSGLMVALSVSLGRHATSLVHSGLNRSEIGSLPTHVYSKINGNVNLSGNRGAPVPTAAEVQVDKDCQICLSTYEEGDMLRTLPCFHEFHRACIDKWLEINRTCPNCH